MGQETRMDEQGTLVTTQALSRKYTGDGSTQATWNEYREVSE